MSCVHMNFDAMVNVARLVKEDNPLDVVGYSASIEIVCRECGCLFRFKGVPGGYSERQPMVSIMGTELRAPIEPSPEYADKKPSDISKN